MSRTINTMSYTRQIAYHERYGQRWRTIMNSYPGAWGGANSGQSEWATIREGQRRAEVRNKITRIVHEANARLRCNVDYECLDLVVSHHRHTVLWDIW